ncbi:DsrE family protein [Streptomyces sp. TS71-3]|uniref:DsrE family protein n=1 Tax=Streptomyces sp. TS71-3 TaxID=2733862 RepID=UPI001B1C37E4|nr:DsrE family protein [Streptomyces sp. TS71-3]GHJ36846.1 hypothetical protein Sm713_24550 [Streptomyces sp. TS71-3]
MTEHLLVETSGPWAGPACARFVEDAAVLAEAGRQVRVLLVDDGVTAAVPGALPEAERLLAGGGQLWVDAFSLGRRGLGGAPLASGCRLVGMAEVADEILKPAVRVVWH